MARKAPKTFEQLAVENGLVTEIQVRECLTLQDESRREAKVPDSVESIMLAKGFMTEEAVHAVQTALGRMSRDEEKSEPLYIGKYEILGKIGDGGLGTVYKARQISMSRDVALKVLHKKWLTDEEFKKRFLLEARVVGRLSHQNLIGVYDVGLDRGIYYFSMEFVDGETIEDQIERDGPLETAMSFDYTIQVLRAIAYIKTFDLVHRDIKPGNMMLTRKGVVKLGDFGFVKSKLDSWIATEGEVLGTPDYISPEQAQGMDDIDWRSDQYSLGCSLYHMLTGKPPYEGSGSSVMRQHIKAEVPDPTTFNKKIPDSAIQVLERMMAKDPGDRYQDVDLFFEDLELVRLGQDPSTARLDAGKSTIIRAFKIEQVRAQRAKTEVELLREDIERMRKYMQIAWLSAGAMFLIAVLALLKAFVWT